MHNGKSASGSSLVTTQACSKYGIYINNWEPESAREDRWGWKEQQIRSVQTGYQPAGGQGYAIPSTDPAGLKVAIEIYQRSALRASYYLPSSFSLYAHKEPQFL